MAIGIEHRAQLRGWRRGEGAQREQVGDEPQRVVQEEGGENGGGVGIQRATGAAYQRTAKKWQALPPSTKQCHTA